VPVDATDGVPPEQAAQLAKKGEGMTTPSKRMKSTMAGISVALVLVGCSTTGTEAPRSPSGPDAVATRSVPASGRGSTYADGSYTATGEYGSLPSSIGVSVTLDDGVVTAVEVAPHATNPTSRDYQERFADAVPEKVVGKPIDEVRVGRLAGSSGTPDGFNAAIEKIEEQASK
jgi:uncharacterized protein with FMN-binding domain